MLERRREIAWGHTVCAAAAALLFGLAPTLSHGRDRSFVPTIIDYNGALEFGMTQETDETASNGNRMKTSDETTSERIRLFTNGYIYHPRFVVFYLQGAAGLRDERFETAAQSSRATRSADEYEFRTFVLP